MEVFSACKAESEIYYNYYDIIAVGGEQQNIA